MKKYVNKIVFVIILCLAIGALNGCDENSSKSANEKVASNMENSLVAEIDDLGDQVSVIYGDNYDSIYQEIKDKFETDYYSKLSDILKEKEYSSKSNFDMVYEEAFEKVFEECYESFKNDSKTVIYLEDDVYSSIYNDIKDSYYNEFKEMYVK